MFLSLLIALCSLFLIIIARACDGKVLGIFHHMRVSAYDEVETFVSQPACQFALFGNSFGHVFVAPMDGHDLHVDVFALEATEVGCYLGRVDVVDYIGLNGEESVSAVGDVEQRNPESLQLQDKRIAVGTVSRIAVGAHVGAIGHLVECALQAAFATVQNMVVGQRDDIEAAVNECILVAVRSGERGVR